MKRSVHQFVPNLAIGDAISQQVLTLRRMLRELGCDSEIYAQHVHSSLEGEARPFHRFREEQGEHATVFFHFSIGSEVTDYYRQLSNPRVLVYHNITPPEYFRGVNERVAAHCAVGRDELASLRAHCDFAVADSEFNRRELEDLGFEQSAVLPIVLDPSRYAAKPVNHLFRSYRDGQTNLLHVGRLVPNKRIEDILKTFYFFRKKIRPESRLFLVGIDTDTEIYAFALREMVQDLGIAGVSFAGGVSQRELVTYYQLADAYLCMSEHEGFCVPLVEAMSFGVPILASAQPAIVETLGDAGAIVERKDYPQIAELLRHILDDGALRGRMVERGRLRCREFLPEAVRPRLAEVLETLEALGSRNPRGDRSASPT